MAQFRAEHHAAFGLDARGQRRVVVRREVQVIRCCEIEAAVARGADDGRKKAGGAPIVDGKADPWHVQYRHILDAQRHVARDTAAVGAIEFDRGARKFPRVVARLAAREHAIVDRDDAARVGVDDDVGGAARGGFVQQVRSIEQLARAGLLIDRCGGAGQQQARLADADVAFELRGGVAAVVDAAVGCDERVLLQNLHVAFQRDDVVGRFELVGIQHDCAGRTRHFRKRGFDIGAAASGIERGLLFRRQFFPGHPVGVGGIG